MSSIFEWIGKNAYWIFDGIGVIVVTGILGVMFKKRKQIKKRDKYLCQLCLKDNIYTYDNLQVHHIIPLAEDYNKKLDSDNLITLCRMHHEQAEKGIISKEELYELLEVPSGV